MWKRSREFSFLSEEEAREIDLLYPPAFREYLSRFLLNYDSSFKEWWESRAAMLPEDLEAEQAARQEMNNFGAFQSSIFYGLQEFCIEEGPEKLGALLAVKYATNQDAIMHLSQVLSFINGANQPSGTIKDLLDRQKSAPPRTAQSRGSTSPFLQLLPPTLAPVLLEQEGGRRYAAPSFAVPGAPAALPWALPAAVASAAPPAREAALDAKVYALFAAGGAFGCTLTHLAVVPLDVVKTRLQTAPGRYANLADGVRTIYREEGGAMLLQGAAPTMVGYLWYGLTVYPGYEFFKRLYVALAGPAGDAAYHTPLVLAAGASATFFACLGVCPAEAVRIRAVADPGFAPSGAAALRRIVAEEGPGQLYAGFRPLLVRQVVFGMMKFFVFDSFADAVFAAYPELAQGAATALGVSLLSGLVAGVASCVVSQPADTVLSTINKQEGTSIPQAVAQIWGERGPGGFFLGLGSRCAWSGAVISGQFLLYDLAKQVLGVAPPDLTLNLDALASAVGDLAPAVL